MGLPQASRMELRTPRDERRAMLRRQHVQGSRTLLVEYGRHSYLRRIADCASERAEAFRSTRRTVVLRTVRTRPDSTRKLALAVDILRKADAHWMWLSRRRVDGLEHSGSQAREPRRGAERAVLVLARSSRARRHLTASAQLQCTCDARTRVYLTHAVTDRACAPALCSQSGLRARASPLLLLHPHEHQRALLFLAGTSLAASSTPLACAPSGQLWPVQSICARRSSRARALPVPPSPTQYSRRRPDTELVRLPQRTPPSHCRASRATLVLQARR